MSKGAKIIGSSSDLLAALVLDSKKATFFEDKNKNELAGNIRELLNRAQNDAPSRVHINEFDRPDIVKASRSHVWPHISASTERILLIFGSFDVSPR
ncbi:hypothetical protein L596_021221 [Steinernema carpocapsae]|uniref:Uncharacterized protein n=1 Tax=Steinernema carpocapsae TaxID=34508 RepID=A0A4U5MVU5_STECR|nr:hypothetical protein L596_021221 [Steinernema carpocapsae]